MTTKDQERQAIEKIRKIVEGLGENSYVGFAMDGMRYMFRTSSMMIMKSEMSSKRFTIA